MRRADHGQGLAPCSRCVRRAARRLLGAAARCRAPLRHGADVGRPRRCLAPRTRPRDLRSHTRTRNLDVRPRGPLRRQRPYRTTRLTSEPTTQPDRRSTVRRQSAQLANRSLGECSSHERKVDFVLRAFVCNASLVCGRLRLLREDRLGIGRRVRLSVLRKRETSPDFSSEPPELSLHRKEYA